MRDFLKQNTTPMLLMTVLFSSIIYIYAASSPATVLLLTAFGGVYTFVLFLCLDFLQKLNKPPIAAAGVVGLLILSLFIGYLCIDSYPDMLYQWFFEPDKMNRIYVGNIFALIFMCGFVLGSALYYFTRIRYRSVFVFLICMCPFSLFAKTFSDIPVIYIILIATLYFVLLITKQNIGISAGGKNTVIVLSGFIIIVVGAAAFMPKPKFAPYRENFDELITGISIGGAGAGLDFNSYSDSSSYSSSGDDETIVFTIKGSNPGLIKRQCFNLYNLSSDTWSYYGESETGYNNIWKYISWADPRTFNYTNTNFNVKEASAVIETQNGRIRALYTPENLSGFSLPEGRTSNIYRTPMDEYFLSANNPAITQYTIRWYELEPDASFSEIMSQKYKDICSTASYGEDYLSVLDENNELYEYLLSVQVRRDCFGSDDGFEKFGELARKITENCGSDLEKATAIEQYFLSDIFVYDDEFAPVDSSPETFLFNYRRGVCSDYATAMVLLCRELGLKSRYVEGFLVQKYNSENEYYYVTAADSHAYVQVWIDGYGWTDFDPTSTRTDGGYFDNTFLIFGGIVVLIALVGGFVVFAVPKIKDRALLKRAAKLRGREQAVILFPRVNKLVHAKLGKHELVYTVSELKKNVSEKYGADISELADAYERTVYGEENIGGENYMPTYARLIRQIKQKEKEERKRKPQK